MSDALTETIFERRCEKTICENKDAITAKLISAFVFATRIVQSLYFISRTFQKKITFFGQKNSKILCLVFDFICITYIESDY